jgi:hypothetical protein
MSGVEEDEGDAAIGGDDDDEEGEAAGGTGVRGTKVVRWLLAPRGKSKRLSRKRSR